MDCITHLINKLQAERARNPIHHSQQQQPAPEATPPPPYDHLDTVPDSDSATYDSESEPDTVPSPEPIKLTINGPHTIHGSNNLVPITATPLSDAAKFSTLLLHAINSINATAVAGNGGGGRGGGVRLDLTINCGVTVVGDRNVVGGVGVRPKGAALSTQGVDGEGKVGTGAKRKAEEDAEEEPASKRQALEQASA